MVAALILGTTAIGELGLVYPLIVPAIGVVTAVIGIFAVAPRAGDRSGMSAINRGFFISAIISAVLVTIATYAYLPATLVEVKGVNFEDWTSRWQRAETFNLRFMAIGAVHHRHRPGGGDPAADGLLHRDQPAPG